MSNTTKRKPRKKPLAPVTVPDTKRLLVPLPGWRVLRRCGHVTDHLDITKRQAARLALDCCDECL